MAERHAEIVPLRRQGGVGGFIHFLSNLSGIIGPALTGFLIQYFGGYHSAFLFGSLIDFAGVLAMLFFIHGHPPATVSAIAQPSP